MFSFFRGRSPIFWNSEGSFWENYSIWSSLTGANYLDRAPQCNSMGRDGTSDMNLLFPPQTTLQKLLQGSGNMEEIPAVKHLCVFQLVAVRIQGLLLMIGQCLFSAAFTKARRICGGYLFPVYV